MPDTGKDGANQFDPRHSHEPEIPPVHDAEGRCLICGLLEEKENIRRALADFLRGGFEVEWLRPIKHADGCECEQDGYVVEDVDERCFIVAEFPMLVRHGSSGHRIWAMRLDELAAIVDDFEGEQDPPVVTVDTEGHVTAVLPTCQETANEWGCSLSEDHEGRHFDEKHGVAWRREGPRESGVIFHEHTRSRPHSDASGADR